MGNRGIKSDRCDWFIRRLHNIGQSYAMRSYCLLPSLVLLQFSKHGGGTLSSLKLKRVE